MESYSSAPLYAAPTCCVSVCPHEAPFFNPSTCACHAGVYIPDAEYGSEFHGSETYSAIQSNEQSGYRNLGMSKPDGTIDTRGNVITRAGIIVLWVVFGMFFLMSCYYLKMYSWYSSVASSEVDTEDFNLVGVNDKKLNQSILHFLANPCLIAGVVTLIASLAYLTMATGNGWYIRCHDGRMFFFARYIDWVVTTPLMLHALCHFAHAPDEIWSFMVFSDIVMIVSGLIASTITGAEKWVFFAFSMLAFIPILYYICHLRGQVVDNRTRDRNTGMLIHHNQPDAIYLPYIWFFGNYHFIADLTVVAWFLYPVIWILAEGTGHLSVTGEAIAYAVLDFVAKGVFGWFIVNSRFYTGKDIGGSEVELANKADKGFQK